MELHDRALDALKDCLTLMAWQLELVDHTTGQLGLDSSEQISLIEAFAFQVGQSPGQASAASSPLALVSYPRNKPETMMPAQCCVPGT